MNALLLAGGYGTRLRPLTDKVPKCLVEIKGKPLLGYWLDCLLATSIEKIIINTHYLAKSVENFIQLNYPSPNIILSHEPRLLGTAGTIVKNRHFFNTPSFFLAHADNLTSFCFDSFLACHLKRAQDVKITMMTFDTDQPEQCGIVETDQLSRVIALHEKVNNPPVGRANAAVYWVDNEVIDCIASLKKPVFDFTRDVLPHYLCHIQTFHNTKYHRDIGTLTSLHLAEQEYAELF